MRLHLSDGEAHSLHATSQITVYRRGPNGLERLCIEAGQVEPGDLLEVEAVETWDMTRRFARPGHFRSRVARKAIT